MACMRALLRGAARSVAVAVAVAVAATCRDQALTGRSWGHGGVVVGSWPNPSPVTSSITSVIVAAGTGGGSFGWTPMPSRTLTPTRCLKTPCARVCVHGSWSITTSGTAQGHPSSTLPRSPAHPNPYPARRTGSPALLHRPCASRRLSCADAIGAVSQFPVLPARPCMGALWWILVAAPTPPPYVSDSASSVLHQPSRMPLSHCLSCECLLC